VEDKERQGAGIHNDDDAETNDRVYDIDSDSARPAEGAGDGADEPPAGNEHRPRFSRKQILDRFAEKNSAIGKLQKEKNTLEKEREAWAAEKSALEAQVKENNYRKRTTKEWDLHKLKSRTEVILEVLNSLDDFERAFAAVEPGRDDDFVKGVRLIYSKLLQVLQKMGVAEVDSLHQPFDPTRHMAIGQIETDETASGNVARVITKGYIFNGSVIRPAHVIVAK
jgi:molecular chaperone GrpE